VVVYLPFRKQGLGYIQTVVGNGISEPSAVGFMDSQLVVVQFFTTNSSLEIDSSQCHEAKCFLRMPQWWRMCFFGTQNAKSSEHNIDFSR